MAKKRCSCTGMQTVRYLLLCQSCCRGNTGQRSQTPLSQTPQFSPAPPQIHRPYAQPAQHCTAMPQVLPTAGLAVRRLALWAWGREALQPAEEKQPHGTITKSYIMYRWAEPNHALRIHLETEHQAAKNHRTLGCTCPACTSIPQQAACLQQCSCWPPWPEEPQGSNKDLETTSRSKSPPH